MLGREDTSERRVGAPFVPWAGSSPVTPAAGGPNALELSVRSGRRRHQMPCRRDYLRSGGTGVQAVQPSPYFASLAARDPGISSSTAASPTGYVPCRLS